MKTFFRWAVFTSLSYYCCETQTANSDKPTVFCIVLCCIWAKAQRKKDEAKGKNVEIKGIPNIYFVE